MTGKHLTASTPVITVSHCLFKQSSVGMPSPEDTQLILERIPHSNLVKLDYSIAQSTDGHINSQQYFYEVEGGRSTVGSSSCFS